MSSAIEWTDYGHGIVEFRTPISSIDERTVDNWVEFLETEKSNCYVPFSHSPIRFSQSPNSFGYWEFISTIEAIKTCIADCVEIYANQYPQVRSFLTWRADQHLLIYGPGTQANLHSDNSIDKVTNYDGLAGAVISVSAIVSDKCRGGHLGFTALNKEFAPSKGNVYLFPSSYIGAHYVTPVLDGRRVSFVEWFGTVHRTHPSEAFEIGSRL